MRLLGIQVLHLHGDGAAYTKQHIDGVIFKSGLSNIIIAGIMPIIFVISFHIYFTHIINIDN